MQIIVDNFKEILIVHRLKVANLSVLYYWPLSYGHRHRHALYLQLLAATSHKFTAKKCVNATGEMEEALVVVKKCFNLFYCSELFFISSCEKFCRMSMR